MTRKSLHAAILYGCMVIILALSARGASPPSPAEARRTKTGATGDAAFSAPFPPAPPKPIPSLPSMPGSPPEAATAAPPSSPATNQPAAPPPSPAQTYSTSCYVQVSLGALASSKTNSNSTSFAYVNCMLLAEEMNQLLQPLVPFNCSSNMTVPPSVSTSADLSLAIDMLDSFQSSPTGDVLRDGLGGQCGDYAWIHVQDCMAGTTFTWNHANLPALSCPDACLVSISLSNGSAVGYSAPSTCAALAASATGVLGSGTPFSCDPHISQQGFSLLNTAHTGTLAVVASMDALGATNILNGLQNDTDGLLQLIAAYNYDCRAAQAQIYVEAMAPGTICPQGPATSFQQGPCDPCTSSLPPPLTRNSSDLKFSNYGVICISDSSASPVQYLSHLSLVALSFGDSSVDVIRDFSTWASAGCCAASVETGGGSGGSGGTAGMLPHLPPPPGLPSPPDYPPGQQAPPLELSQARPPAPSYPALPRPPLPPSEPAARSQYCLSSFWYIQYYRIAATNVLEAVGGAQFAFLTSSNGYSLNTTAQMGALPLTQALSGGISLRSDGSCQSGGTVHMAGAAQQVLRLDFPPGGMWPPDVRKPPAQPPLPPSYAPPSPPPPPAYPGLPLEGPAAPSPQPSLAPPHPTGPQLPDKPLSPQLPAKPFQPPNSTSLPPAIPSSPPISPTPPAPANPGRPFGNPRAPSSLPLSPTEPLPPAVPPAQPLAPPQVPPQYPPPIAPSGPLIPTGSLENFPPPPNPSAPLRPEAPDPPAIKATPEPKAPKPLPARPPPAPSRSPPPPAPLLPAPDTAVAAASASGFNAADHIPLLIGVVLGSVILSLVVAMAVLLLRCLRRIKRDTQSGLATGSLLDGDGGEVSVAPYPMWHSLPSRFLHQTRWGSGKLLKVVVEGNEAADCMSDGMPSSDGSGRVGTGGSWRGGANPPGKAPEPRARTIHLTANDSEISAEGVQILNSTFVSDSGRMEESSPGSEGQSAATGGAWMGPQHLPKDLQERREQRNSAFEFERLYQQQHGPVERGWQAQASPGSSPWGSPARGAGRGRGMGYRPPPAMGSRAAPAGLASVHSQRRPDPAAQVPAVECTRATAGLEDVSLFNAYAQLAQAIVEVDDRHSNDASANSSCTRMQSLHGDVLAGVDLDVDFTDLEFSQEGGGALLGAGAVGSVYRAVYKGAPVAVKVITRAIVDGQFVGHQSDDRDASTRGDYDSLTHEIQILARLNHPNVVQCHGGCLRPPRVFVLQELMSATLSGILRQRLPLVNVLKLLLDVARGLEYLHGMSVVHRDLKPANILLDEHQNAKISDFGLARCKFKTYLETRTDAGTVAYMAPEAFDPEIGGISAALDIFSLAVIMWEMATGALPWEGLSNVAIIYQVAVLKTRNPLPEDAAICPPRLAALIERCWVTEPRARPGCGEVVSELDAILRAQLLSQSQVVAPMGALEKPAVAVLGAELPTSQGEQPSVQGQPGGGLGGPTLPRKLATAKRRVGVPPLPPIREPAVRGGGSGVQGAAKSSQHPSQQRAPSPFANS